MKLLHRALTTASAMPQWAGRLSRVVAAVLGGYGIAALLSLAILVLPIEQTQAVMTGMQLSFLAYAAAVVWVFAARTPGRAWAGLLCFALLLAGPVAWVLLRGGV